MKKSEGQSILEVLFATTVVALVLVAVLSTIIASVRNSRTSLEQTRSTNYANEALEWLRKERDSLGWIVFSSYGPGIGSSQTYCFATYPSSATLLSNKAGACEITETIPNSTFRRELTIDRISNEEMAIIVTIYRPSREGESITTLEGRLSQWQ